MTSLCFDTAFSAFRAGQINERDYLHHCLLHFAGERHPQDKHYIQRRQRYTVVGQLDPVGEAIRNAALNTVYIPLQGTLLLESLFDHVSHNNIHALDISLRELRVRKPTFNSIIQPLAVYAAAKGNGDALRFCLEHGATLKDENITLALSMARDQEVYEGNYYDKALYGLATKAVNFIPQPPTIEARKWPRCRI